MNSKNEPNCGKCGLCLNVCPVYRQIKEEQVSPRAKMQLIKSHKDQTLSSSPFLKEIISRCLMCGACAANCPSGIDHYSAFMKMREKMVQDHGDPLTIRSLVYLLSREYRLKFGSGIARTGQKLLPDKIAQSLRVGSIPVGQMPALNKIPFRNTCNEIIEPDADVKGTVAYFTGCATNYLFDDTGNAAVGILKKMGYRIIIPKNQGCCSIPLLFHGAAEKAHQNIENNVTALTDLDADAILVDCSTCGEALKHIYPSLYKENRAMNPAIQNIADKTMDLMTFILQRFDNLKLETSCTDKPRVTYHAPCHSRHRMKTHNAAEALVQKLPCVTYVKSQDMEECCGGGGTFFYEYPSVSDKIMAGKLENVKKADVSLWLTDCPVCRINIGGHLKKEDGIAVSHPLTTLYNSVKDS